MAPSAQAGDQGQPQVGLDGLGALPTSVTLGFDKINECLVMHSPAQGPLTCRDDLQRKPLEFVLNFPSLCSPAPPGSLLPPSPSVLPATVPWQSLDRHRAPSATSLSPEELTFTWRAKCHTLAMLPATTYLLLGVLGPKTPNPVSPPGEQVFPLYAHKTQQCPLNLLAALCSKASLLPRGAHQSQTMMMHVAGRNLLSCSCSSSVPCTGISTRCLPRNSCIPTSCIAVAG